jgi:archaellum biogenesis ATPase FlaH
MGDIFKIIGDLGMPVAAALAGGYFVYLTIKLLLAGVLSSIKGMAGIITALDNRVKTMNHDVVRIDTIDISTMQSVAIGYSALKLFCNRDRVRCSTSNDENIFE